MTLKKRNTEIKKEVKAGATLKEVAKKHGITSQRVSQIAGPVGGKKRNVHSAASKKGWRTRRLRQTRANLRASREAASGQWILSIILEPVPFFVELLEMGVERKMAQKIVMRLMQNKGRMPT